MGGRCHDRRQRKGRWWCSMPPYRKFRKLSKHWNSILKYRNSISHIERVLPSIPLALSWYWNACFRCSDYRNRVNLVFSLSISTRFGIRFLVLSGGGWWRCYDRRQRRGIGGGVGCYHIESFDTISKHRRRCIERTISDISSISNAFFPPSPDTYHRSFYYADSEILFSTFWL